MEIKQIDTNKKEYLPLLLLADEEETMIDRYLERGILFALFDPTLRGVCVVTDEGEGIWEVQNLATEPLYQGQGYGRALLEHATEFCKGRCKTLLVGTGDSPLTVPFYEKCGFIYSHRIPGYFPAHYAEPIFEAGEQLIDKVYLRKDF